MTDTQPSETAGEESESKEQSAAEDDAQMTLSGGFQATEDEDNAEETTEDVEPEADDGSSSSDTNETETVEEDQDSESDSESGPYAGVIEGTLEDSEEVEPEQTESSSSPSDSVVRAPHNPAAGVEQTSELDDEDEHSDVMEPVTGDIEKEDLPRLIAEGLIGICYASVRAVKETSVRDVGYAVWFTASEITPEREAPLPEKAIAGFFYGVLAISVLLLANAALVT